MRSIVTIGLFASLGFALPAFAAGDDDDDHKDHDAGGPAHDHGMPADEDDDPTGPLGEADTVRGSAVLGAVYGSARVQVNARGAGEDAAGTFFIDYENRGSAQGEVTCVHLSGDTAYVVGLVNEEQGLGNFEEGDHVLIGIRDAGPEGQDFLNYTPGLDDEPACGPNDRATPNLPIMGGDFDVRRMGTAPTT